ncbi:MAG: IS1182 family transposase [Candidatus Dormibacteria bacterium]
MLGQRSPQTSMFEGDQLYLEHVGAQTFYGHLARERHNLFRDEEFATLYHASHGRPSVPPSTLCVALLLQTHDRCSDAEARDRAAYDQRWKVALGTGDTEKPFTKSTLQLFRAQLLLHEKLRLPFERSLEVARKSGYLKSHGKLRAAVDTTNILGRGAVRDTYNLIADGIVSVMRILAKASGKPVERWASEHDLSAYRASSIKAEADLDWSNEAEKQAFLGVLVEDAKKVVELAGKMRTNLVAGSPADKRLMSATEVLTQILLQDVESAGDGGGRAKKIRQGTSAERIVSVHDPEMRHGRKSSSTRFDGHKLAVTADVETQLVTAVDVMSGGVKDQEGSLELVRQSEANTSLGTEAVLGDTAYGGGENRESFAEAGIPLLAKVARLNNGEFFSKDRFEIDTEKMTCRCPAGQVTDRLVRAGVHTRRDGERTKLHAFQFSPDVCTGCPLRSDCFKPGPKGRVVRLHPQEAMIQAAKQWQRSPAFDDFRKQRQVVEHRIARMVQLGVRQARYFGRRKTLFQALMAAAVANLTLVLSKTGGLGTPVGPPGRLHATLQALLDAVRPATSPANPRGWARTNLSLTSQLRPTPRLTVLKMATCRPHL